ncbi:MAG: outer membrane protein assembly factor BamE [Anderseniella sp.]|nr:outer membrane protein assembly factor BamE [Anderseniella sp.]
MQSSKATYTANRSSFKSALVKAAVAVALTAVASGCAREIEHRGYQARAQDMQQLRMGMSKTEVRSVLGSPSTTATVQYQGDSYYYISSRVKTSAFLENEELDRQILAVRFDQFDQVQSFGQYTLQDGQVIDMNSRKTPSRGRELTILQQMFGNLGNFTPNDQGPPQGGMGG